MDGDNTPAKSPRTVGLMPPWKPGQSGNPAGRPKGSRSKLSEAFFKALMEDFEKRGAELVTQVGDERPHDLLKILATLVRNEDEDERGETILRAIFGGGRINRNLGN